MQLTVREAARLLGVSEKTVYRWIHQGTIPAYRVSEQYRFNRAELIEWATSRKISIPAEALVEPDRPGAAAGLVQAIESGGVFHGVGGTDRESALRAVVDLLALPEDTDREFLLRVLLAREALGSTGVGEGIAIPHARNPLVLHAARPAIALCFLEKPVDFGAIDGQPVSALFSLISPTVREHLSLLSRLAFALRDAGFKEAVIRQKGREDILREARRVEEKLEQGPVSGAGR